VTSREFTAKATLGAGGKGTPRTVLSSSCYYHRVHNAESTSVELAFVFGKASRLGLMNTFDHYAVDIFSLVRAAQPIDTLAGAAA